MLVTIATTIAIALALGPSAARQAPAASAAGACAGRDRARGRRAPRPRADCLINRARAAHGLRAAEAQRGARRWPPAATPRDMVERTFFDAHQPGRLDARRRACAAPATAARAIGETLAFAIGPQATPAGAVRGWLRSPPHRRVLLDRPMRDIGAGFARGRPAEDQGRRAGRDGRAGRRRLTRRTASTRGADLQCFGPRHCAVGAGTPADHPPGDDAQRVVFSKTPPLRARARGAARPGGIRRRPAAARMPTRPSRGPACAGRLTRCAA